MGATMEGRQKLNERRIETEGETEIEIETVSQGEETEGN